MKKLSILIHLPIQAKLHPLSEMVLDENWSNNPLIILKLVYNVMKIMQIMNTEVYESHDRK